MKQQVIILAGNVGTGKSLIANKLAKMGFVTVNMDNIRSNVAGGEYDRYDCDKRGLYHAIEVTTLETALEMGFNVVVDRTNMARETRSKYIEICKSFEDINIFGIDFGPGSAITLSRRCLSSRNIPMRKWQSVFESMKLNYEPMSLDEGFDEIMPTPVHFHTIAYDFDGTIVENEFPDIGKINENIVSDMRERWKSLGNIIIIWSCRHSDEKSRMRQFLIKNEIPFDFINENPLFETGSRKVFAHEYVDDRNVMMIDK